MFDKLSFLFRGKYLYLTIIAPLVVIADQVTKWLAASNLQPLASLRPGERFVTVIDGFFRFKYVENPGAAWGLLRDASAGFRIPFFIIVSIIAIGVIMWFFKKVEPKQRMLASAIALVLGGAVGNLIDRIVMGRVIDFIDWYVTFDSPMDLGLFVIDAGEKHWPTFNVADAAITIGVILLMVEMFFGKGFKDSQSKKATESVKAK
jgi:signal peptidase II